MSRFSAFLLLTITSSRYPAELGSTAYLESFTTSSTANGQQIFFVATGTFTAPPITVTPLPVDWTLA